MCCSSIKITGQLAIKKLIRLFNFQSIPLKINCKEIELTGVRDGIDASFGYYTKGIYVDVGGNLDIHGQEKLSWTKLTETLTPMKPFGLKRFVCN